MKNNNNRLIYTGAFLAATLTFGQVVQADSLVLSRGNQTISRDTVVDSVVVGHTLDDSIAGSGHLIVNNGAQLVNNGTGHYLGMIDGVNFNAGNGYLGLNTDSMGVATITGASSLWQNEKDLYVGRYGTGSLNIEKVGKLLMPKVLSEIVPVLSVLLPLPMQVHSGKLQGASSLAL